MPKRSRSKRASSRAAAKRSKMVIYRTPMTIPDVLTVHMKYGQNLALSSGVAAETYSTFRALSVFDPWYTGAGNQPFGHDSYSNLYLRYRVKKVKIEVWGDCTSTDTHLLGIVAHEELTNPPASFVNCSETPTSVVTMIGSKNGSPTTKKLTLGWFTPERFKGDKGAKYDMDYQAAFGSNCNKDFGLTVYGANGAGNLSVAITCYVLITYEVELKDRKQQVQS